MTAWLSVVGMGDDGWAGLPESHQLMVQTADVLVCGQRHLNLVPGRPDRETILWASPLLSTVEQIQSHRGKRVVVLATGDPLDFGIATTLLRYFDKEELRVFPSPSSLSLACARMGWSRQDVDCVSVHGRPIELLNSFLFPGAKLLVLSQNGSTPRQAADLLTKAGYGLSTMTVLAHLNSDQESQVTETASKWEADNAPDLNVIAIECRTESTRGLLGRVPGLPDEAFISDGQLTKRTIRASTLSRLRPTPGQLLWDVGAGSGSVSIEWMLHHPRCRAIAIEHNDKRLGFLADNMSSLGTPALKVVQGAAPFALEGLEQPDAVFVGGGVRDREIMDFCFKALKSGGRLIANAVTLEAEAVLLSFFAEKGGSLERIALSAADPVGGLHGWRPSMPVTQYCLIKE